MCQDHAMFKDPEPISLNGVGYVDVDKGIRGSRNSMDKLALKRALKIKISVDFIL